MYRGESNNVIGVPTFDPDYVHFFMHVLTQYRDLIIHRTDFFPDPTATIRTIFARYPFFPMDLKRFHDRITMTLETTGTFLLMELKKANAISPHDVHTKGNVFYQLTSPSTALWGNRINKPNEDVSIAYDDERHYQFLPSQFAKRHFNPTRFFRAYFYTLLRQTKNKPTLLDIDTAFQPEITPSDLLQPYIAHLFELLVHPLIPLNKRHINTVDYYKWREFYPFLEGLIGMDRRQSNTLFLNDTIRTQICVILSMLVDYQPDPNNGDLPQDQLFSLNLTDTYQHYDRRLTLSDKQHILAKRLTYFGVQPPATSPRTFERFKTLTVPIEQYAAEKNNTRIAYMRFLITYDTDQTYLESFKQLLIQQQATFAALHGRPKAA